MRRLLNIFLIVLFLSCSSLSWAGNKKMVEETVREMDELNKQAVQQIPDLPKDGKVDMKAKVRYEKEKPVFDIYYKRTSEKDDEINFGDKEQKEPSEKEDRTGNDAQDN